MISGGLVDQDARLLLQIFFIREVLDDELADTTVARFHAMPGEFDLLNEESIPVIVVIRTVNHQDQGCPRPYLQVRCLISDLHAEQGSERIAQKCFRLIVCLFDFYEHKCLSGHLVNDCNIQLAKLGAALRHAGTSIPRNDLPSLFLISVVMEYSELL